MHHLAWRAAGVRWLVLAALMLGASGRLARPPAGAEAAHLRAPAAGASAASVAEPPGAPWRLPVTGGGDGGRAADGVGGEALGPEWEPTAVGGPVAHVRLSGGAVYVVTGGTGGAGGAPSRLWRGDDRGAAWRELAAPATRVADLAAHPLDDRVLYMAGEGGIYQSSDAGQTWRPALAAPAAHQGLRVALSPADPALLYAVTGAFSGAAVWRSVDSGATWTRLRDLQATLCTWTFPVVAPDPVVRERVFLSYGCLAGRNTSATLTVSEDQWASDGTPLLVPSARTADPLGYLYPQAAAFAPDRQRGVVLALRDQRLGGSALVRTDDGGRTWRALLDYGPSMAGGRQVGPNVVLGGLAAAGTGGPEGSEGSDSADASDVQSLFVGLGRDGQGVLGSADGGLTWHRVGQGAVGSVRALAADDTAGVLYAGTDRGLWRLPVLSWPPSS